MHCVLGTALTAGAVSNDSTTQPRAQAARTRRLSNHRAATLFAHFLVRHQGFHPIGL
ncbi:hypothetical protein MMSP_2747 [Mycobacterium sp. 012931]|nr:hypothetical protein MMSP_2747 [Mycobacterium sp. 012931]MBC9863718.1 hypothetical protein [Mycobacterium pseudoshottsii]